MVVDGQMEDECIVGLLLVVPQRAKDFWKAICTGQAKEMQCFLKARELALHADWEAHEDHHDAPQTFAARNRGGAATQRSCRMHATCSCTHLFWFACRVGERACMVETWRPECDWAHASTRSAHHPHRADLATACRGARKMS